MHRVVHGVHRDSGRLDISDRYIDRHNIAHRAPDARARRPPARGVACDCVGVTADVRYAPPVRHHVDYALARRAVLRDLRTGKRDRLDVCDAQPELLRAARNIGEAAFPTAAIWVNLPGSVSASACATDSYPLTRRTPAHQIFSRVSRACMRFPHTFLAIAAPSHGLNVPASIWLHYQT